MSWEWVYLRARLVPLVGSLVLVGVVNGVAPLALPVWLLGSVIVGIVATRTSAWRVVSGARRPTAGEREVIRAAVGMVPGLRGRNEPTAWVCDGPRPLVHFSRQKDVLVSAGWVRGVQAGEVAVESLAVEVAAAWGQSLTRRTWTAIVDASCWPVKIVMTPLSWLGRRFPPLRWMLPGWLVFAPAITVVQQASAQRWLVVASVTCFAAAVVLAPRWSGWWGREVDRLAADAVRETGLTGHGLVAADPSTRPEIPR